MVTQASFFRRPADLRRWFAKNHRTALVLWVGFHKVGTGEASITWPESVDEALRVGWIDGVRKRIDERRYAIRFTPRKPGSTWSAVNIRRVEALAAEGRMQPAGTRAFEARREDKSAIYSYEQRPADLVEPYAGIFRGKRAAWRYFEAQPPGYRKTLAWWVVSAKKEQTRLLRLEKLIAASALGRRL